MKLYSLAIVGLVAGGKTDEKKVPPRHPLQRLNRLNDFISEIFEMHGDGAGIPEHRQAKWVEKFGSTTRRMEIAFRRQTKKCGFYNADDVANHGGHASDGYHGDAADAVGNDEHFNDGGYTGGDGADNRPVLSSEHINYQGGLDNWHALKPHHDDHPTGRKRRAAGDVGDGLDRYNRDDPCVGTLNIIQGYRKWSDRYLGLCGGQNKFEHHRRRALKWYARLTGNRGWQCINPKPLPYSVDVDGPDDHPIIQSEESTQLTDDSTTTYGVDCTDEDCTPANK